MQKPHLILSSGVDDTPENREVVKNLKILAAKDGCSFSKLLWAAAVEYYQRHSPGNPQLILGHWTVNTPLPKTLEHKHRWGYDSGGGAQWIYCKDCGEHKQE